MADFRFSPRAYCKMMLHAAKYPHCAVNGVLLAKQTSSSDDFVIEDAIPMFHICLQVSPMAEIALTQIDQLATAQGLVIAGYYMANESIRDLSTDKPGHRIAEKIAENFPSALLVLIDNKNFTLNMESPAIIVSQHMDGKWQKNIRVEVKGEILDTTATLLEKRSFQSLVDFDNHLDDITQDWRNSDLNNEIETLIEQA